MAPRSSVAAPARSSSSYRGQTDPNPPDYGAAIIVLNDAGEKVLTNDGKEYGVSYRTIEFDFFKCMACVQLAREWDWTPDSIRSKVRPVKVAGLHSADPRLRSDPNSIRHYCCTGYTPVSAKRKAPTDANDRLAKRHRPKYEEEVDEPDVFGQAVRMKDGSYECRLKERGIILRYKEDSKVSAEIHGAKDVYCVGCTELDPHYDCRAVIFRGNFVLFDPAEGDGDNVHICLKKAGERKKVRQSVASHQTLHKPTNRASSTAETEQQGPSQLAADVLDAPLVDADALLHSILAHADTMKTKSETQDNSVQAVDSSPLVHSSPAISPAMAGGSSVSGSRTTSAARSKIEVVELSDSDDEDALASSAPSAKIKVEPPDASNALPAPVSDKMQIRPSPTPPRTSTAASAEHVPDFKPPRVVPGLRPSGVPRAYRNKKVFGKADFITEGSETYAVYKQEHGSVEYKFKQLRTSTETLEGETFEVGTFECSDCDRFLADRGLTDAIGLVTVANGYFVVSHPQKPERIDHCCKPSPQRR